MVTSFDKAIVAGLIALLSVVLPHVGLNLDSTLSEALTALVGGLLVWVTPNK